jgi:hypothetical protein
VGAVISLEIDDDDSSFAELPWLVTFEPDDEEGTQEWDAFSCGPYLHAHALAIAEAVAFEQDGVIAVVAPVLPALSPDDVTAMIEQRRAEAEAAVEFDVEFESDELDDELEEDDEDDESEDLDEADDVDELDDEAEVDELEEDDAEDEEGDEADELADELEEDDEADDEDDDDDEADLDVIEIDVDEIEVPEPDEIRAGIETVMQRLLAHTAPVAESV